ncbi:dimethylarginine dimethylaminohydrolase family protein [Alkaliphilus peptidifermentans]|uniref:N-Dimethylarginine dimethylaminohydrolase n=1 Tax=Alkaliphilus peptidifermentans DSM 18978 TaxID=1120976 RepID=A0A1G5L0Y6_9FIRM|nr:arginine deiminase family protein [Alkaliphilus peptidifermentans]SCZ06476.1 N-Dimethylarginine dimethylaminohydrolase [Alkaliphilus peptidifermentans DSM 18978]
MNISFNNEYDKLASCIIAYPCNIQVSSNISPAGQIDKLIASKQYNKLINTLMDNDVKTYLFDLNGSTAQVFTRDIGFVINDILFVSNMTQPERQTEIAGLIDLAKQHNIKNHIMTNKAEGGDILVHQGKLFIGVGNRTSEEAVEEILHVLSLNNYQYEVIKVYFNKTKIHLDCVFNILDKNTCITTIDIFNPEDVLKHFANAIEIPIEELDSLAANIIDIGNDIILCSSEAFSKSLKRHGYKTIYIEFNEIIKASGSLGCCLMPLLKV